MPRNTGASRSRDHQRPQSAGFQLARSAHASRHFKLSFRIPEKYGLENEDEWIVLEAAGNFPTKGWKIDADDNGQRYALPDTIYRKLYVYTKQGPGYVNDTIMTLNKGSWIWNNTEPDTARIFDANGNLVDLMSYIGE